jgi:hypothetical protein
VTGKKLDCYCAPLGFEPGMYEKKSSLPAGYEEHYIPKNKCIIGYAGSIRITNTLDSFISCASNM